MTPLPDNLILICSLLIALGSIANLSGAEPAKPQKIALHPAAAPVPSLKYRLLPSRTEQKRGNAAVHYGKVTAEETVFFSMQDLRDNIVTWQTLPLEELRGGKVHLPSQGGIEESLRRGALCTECDWELPIGDVPFYTMLLPDIQQSRAFGRVLAARARIQLADGKFDDAVITLQTGYALGRNVATSETLVSGLVGVAIFENMSQQIVDFVQQPAAPNLYWALTLLPTPLIDTQRALDVERMGLELTFPELVNVRTAKKSPDEWRDQYQRIFSRELGWQLASGNDSPKWPSPEETDKRCRELLPAARQLLIANGLKKKEVEAMSPYHVATVYSLAVFHEYFDDCIKYYRLPYPQASAGINATTERLKQERREIAPVAERVLPAIRTCRSALTRVERGIAVLRLFEALRIYAAGHAGKLPGALDDITDVPIPNDPVTGQPFDYKRADEKALLRGPTFRDIPLNYEITMTPGN